MGNVLFQIHISTIQNYTCTKQQLLQSLVSNREEWGPLTFLKYFGSWFIIAWKRFSLTNAPKFALRAGFSRSGPQIRLFCTQDIQFKNWEHLFFAGIHSICAWYSDMQSFPHEQEKKVIFWKTLVLFKREESGRRHFAITVKHAMSKAMNNTICLNIVFLNCPIAKMLSRFVR